MGNNNIVLMHLLVLVLSNKVAGITRQTLDAS